MKKAVFDSLRAWFSLFSKQAQTKLISLRRAAQTILQEHAVEVKCVAGVAHGDLPDSFKANTTAEMFCSTLNNPGLQWHLLAVQNSTLTNAIPTGTEFLQILPGECQQTAV